jgi:hypothetical protein
LAGARNFSELHVEIGTRESAIVATSKTHAAKHELDHCFAARAQETSSISKKNARLAKHE